MVNNDSNILDWDSAIESDGGQFVLLPEGEYDFTVTSLERGHFPGSAKLPPCNKATLTLTVALPDGGTALCREDLILHRALEWKLSAFFRSIGQKKNGERMVMDWSKVPGSRGRARFKPRTFVSGGVERAVNAVERYLDSDRPREELPDWVREAEQAVADGTVGQLPMIDRLQMACRKGDC